MFDFIFASKRKKGKSLLIIPDEYIVIDIETTGFNPRFDSIIELGVVKICNNNIVDSFSTLIKPNIMDESSDYFYPSYHLNDFITELTGITTNMLKTAPLFKDIVDEFLSFIGNYILVGHNVNFDINFLYDNILEHTSKELNNDFCDLLRISRRALPNLKDHELSTVAEYFKIPSKGSHRAYQDCLITFECFSKISDYILSNGIDMRPPNEIRLSELHTENTTFNENSPFIDKICAFTGKLDKLTRAEAAKIVVDLGGLCKNNLTKQTNYLIMGNNDYCPTLIDGKSNKQKKAEDLIAKGADLKIITESTFYDIIQYCNEEIPSLAKNNPDDYIDDAYYINWEEVIPPFLSSFNNCKIDSIEGKHICLSGKFNYGSNASVGDYIIQNGGKYDEDLKMTTDILVISTYEWERYSRKIYSRKIKKAWEYNQRNCNIQIIKESDFSINYNH